MTNHNDTCVHTEHCCFKHGCKYGDEECPVELGVKKQSFPCETCSDFAGDIAQDEALRDFVSSFETDFVVDGEIVDNPDNGWSQLTRLYLKARKALDTENGDWYQ